MPLLNSNLIIRYTTTNVLVSCINVLLFQNRIDIRYIYIYSTISYELFFQNDEGKTELVNDKNSLLGRSIPQ